MRFAVVVCALLALGCAGPVPCSSDADCGAGAVCVERACADSDAPLPLPAVQAPPPAGPTLRWAPGAAGIANDERAPDPAPDVPPSPDGGSDPVVPPPGPPSSCAEVLSADPAASSGPFEVTSSTGLVHEIICDMTTDGGGWTRVVDWTFDEGCPAGWVQKPKGCGHEQKEHESNVASTSFAVPIASFAEVRGRVEAFAVGTNNGFQDGWMLLEDIDGFYVDGVSITVGAPRTHVWTFAAGISDPRTMTMSHCPCRGGAGPPLFIHGDFSCEEPSRLLDENEADEGDTLWDGNQIVDDGTCEYSPTSRGGFSRALDASAAGPIEVRILGGHVPHDDDENVLVQRVELWVR